MMAISNESLDMLHPSQVVGNQFEADRRSDCIHSESGISSDKKDKFNTHKKRWTKKHGSKCVQKLTKKRKSVDTNK